MSDITLELGPSNGDPVDFEVGATAADPVTFDVGAGAAADIDLTSYARLDQSNRWTAGPQTIAQDDEHVPFADIATTDLPVHMEVVDTHADPEEPIWRVFSSAVDLGGGTVYHGVGGGLAEIGPDGERTGGFVQMASGPNGLVLNRVDGPSFADQLSAELTPVSVGAPTDGDHAATKTYVDGVCAAAQAVALSDATPQALGTAAAGTGTKAARDDHVHAPPSAGQIGAATSSDIDAAIDAITPADIGAVPTSRTINGYDMSTNRSLTASDVSALPSSTVIPWASQIEINCAVRPPSTCNTWTPTESAVIGGGYAGGATTVGGETWTFARLPLSAGTWTIIWTYRRWSGGGIITPTLGGTSLTTVDTYGATTAGSVRATQTGITVAADGRYDLVLTNPTKNASASAYGWTLQTIALVRTGS